MFLPSAQLESVTIHPVNAIAVRIQWSAHQHLSTSLRYTGYFTATGVVMSRYEKVLPPGVEAHELTLDDTVEGYEHNFTLHYCDDAVVHTTFAFGWHHAWLFLAILYLPFCYFTDKKTLQIQFGPIDYCLNWGVSTVYPKV